MNDSKDLPQLPFLPVDGIDLSPRYAALQRSCPVAWVRTPAGDPAWLVTGYREATDLFADRRLGRSHPNPDQASRISDAGIMEGLMADHDTEHRDQVRMRRLLAPAFSAKRVRRLSHHILHRVDELIDDMTEARVGDEPVDLNRRLAIPLPLSVICDLLGIPTGDRADFTALSHRAATMTGSDPKMAMAELATFTAKLLDAKRRRPGLDVLSDLVAAQHDDPTLDDDEAVRLATGLLFAGFENTAHRISLGVILLLTEHGSGTPAWSDDASGAAGLVEEVLRLAAPGEVGTVRYAGDDITAGDRVITRGDAVILATYAANRDVRTFARPFDFKPSRAPNPHLSFGHGPHFCLGATLARIELHTVFTRLFHRIPTLRLAVEPEELALHTDRVSGGLHELPITW